MEQQDRNIKTLDIITKLNKTHRQGSDGYYDCGELGVVHIYWHQQRWEWEWIEISDEFKAEGK